MRFVMVFIWSVLISATVAYVLSSMAGDPFNLTLTAILAVFFTIAISLLGDGVLNESQEQ